MSIDTNFYFKKKIMYGKLWSLILAYEHHSSKMILIDHRLKYLNNIMYDSPFLIVHDL